MSRLAERTGLSPAEYLAWEASQPERHEYFDGEVFAMAGGSPRHNALAVNVSAALLGGLREKGCSVLSSDQKLGVGRGTRYVYADVTVVCGPLRLQSGTTDVLENPNVVVEVLSGTTEQYDRGLKWESYQRLESLTDYLLVSQTEARIEHYRRGADGDWTYRAVEGGGRVELASGVTLDVDAIYSGAFSIEGE